MTLLEIISGLKDNSIVVNHFGHHCNDVSDSIKKYYNWMKECAEDEKTGLYTTIIEKDYTSGDILMQWMGDGCYCFDCGEYFKPFLVDEKTVGLVSRSYSMDKRKLTGAKGLISVDINDVTMCQMNEDRKKGFLKSEINVPSGNLIFRNFFSKGELYDFPKGTNTYDSDNSINCIRGRKNLMKYLSTQNIGYGQMGSMNVNVFLKKDGSEIIIGSDYGYTEEKGEYTIKHKGFKNLGDISLSVWRWMCGDLEVLKEKGEIISKSVQDMVDNGKVYIDEDYHDIILARVKTGTWVIEHYYDLAVKDVEIYSRLYLKE